MRKYLLVFIAFSFCCLEAFPIGETPQQIIGSLDVALKGIRKNVLDSVKSSLSSRYVEDYRTYGSSVAYDSLSKRVRVLKAANEHNESDTLASTRYVEQPMSEVDRLRQENNALRKEISILKYGQEKEPELTQLQKRTRWIVKKMVWDNNDAADTLWKVYKDTSFGRGPLCFDSISRRALTPFMPKYVKPKYLLAKQYEHKETRFEELYRRNDIRNLVNEKVVFSLVGRDPGVFDFVSLGNAYSDDMGLVSEKTRNVSRVDVGSTDDFGTDIFKPKSEKQKKMPWTTEGKFTLQFTQYYVTENWYKGGEPNAMLLGDLKYDKKYLQDKKLWDNQSKIKLGFYTSPNDTIRAFRVNNDEFFISSFIGYSVIRPKLYAGAYGDFSTQFFRNYKGTNSDVIKASFFSPTTIKLSLGARYDYNASINGYISPLAYKLIFLVNDDIKDPKTVGIAHGKAQNAFGFLGTGKVKWKFSKDINVESDLNIFAPYNLENVLLNWNTSGFFNINRFLTTKLSLNLHFDSTPESKDYESPKLQIQELFSFGFQYKI